MTNQIEDTAPARKRSKCRYFTTEKFKSLFILSLIWSLDFFCSNLENIYCTMYIIQETELFAQISWNMPKRLFLSEFGSFTLLLTLKNY